DPTSAAAAAQPAPEAQQSTKDGLLSEAHGANPVILSEARSAESKDLHLSLNDTAPSSVQHAGCPMSPAVGDMGERDSAPASEPELTCLSAAAADDPIHYPLLPIPCRHPLDDIPLAPLPQSVCEPCVAALAQGADESLLGCKVCPASKAGNLRAPRFPDPRNPPETPHEPTPIPPIGQAAFRDLKTKWEDALDRLGHKRADVRFPRYGEPREDFRAARRERPFADFLHRYATAPPPPIPPQPAAPLLATPAEESRSR
ncbi:MAG TPA: hypothetical protein VFJ10_10315, partial [Acidobacteriaceae bacterium]|nr:hypothetical protein [Acidobacteriaceae bacterium]